MCITSGKVGVFVDYRINEYDFFSFLPMAGKTKPVVNLHTYGQHYWKEILSIFSS